MGIYGLDYYVSNNFQGWSRVVLDGKHVVVNGNGVCRHISANMDTDNSTGVALDLAACIKSKFQLLLGHNVRPLVVFQKGFPSEHYEAKGTAKKHFEPSVNNTSKVRSVITPLANAVFCSVMKELQLPMLLIKYPDGHKKIASIAKHYHCPLLGADTSFFFFDLPYGYIPWNKITPEGDKLVGKAVEFNTLWSEFGLHTKEIPLILPSLLGTNYLTGLCDKSEEMCQVINSNTSYTRSKIEQVLHFLQRFKNFDEFFYFLPPTIAEEFIPHHAKVLQNFTIQNINGLDDLKLKLPPTSAMRRIPTWLETETTNGNVFASTVVSFLTSNKGMTSGRKPSNRDNRIRSAFQCSSSIRKVIYGILSSIAASTVFKEITYYRDGSVDEIDVNCEAEAKSCPNISGVLHLPTEIKRSNLMKALKCTSNEELALINELPPQLRLPVATSIYWIKICQPVSQMKMALLQSMAFCQLGIAINQSMAIKVDDEVFTQSQIHSAQWQSCYFSALVLNFLLQEPLEATSVVKVYNEKIFTFYALTPGVHRELGSDLDKLAQLEFQ